MSKKESENSGLVVETPCFFFCVVKKRKRKAVKESKFSLVQEVFATLKDRMMQEVEDFEPIWEI